MSDRLICDLLFQFLLNTCLQRFKLLFMIFFQCLNFRLILGLEGFFSLQHIVFKSFKRSLMLFFHLTHLLFKIAYGLSQFIRTCLGFFCEIFDFGLLTRKIPIFLVTLELGLKQLLFGRHKFGLFGLKFTLVQLSHILVPATALVHFHKALVLLSILLLNSVDFFGQGLFLSHLLTELGLKR